MLTAAILTSLLALQASAFPFVLESLEERAPIGIEEREPFDLEERQTVPPAGSPAAKQASAARTNCGVNPCLVFDAAKQYVSTSGKYAWKAPGKTDIRGPCPGLNAAANHGYLAHSGVQTIAGTVTGMGLAFGMSPDLAGFLAAYAVVFDGDPVLGTWSIGGPPPANAATKSILGQAQGISYSHNNYEGDVSIGRNDAYLNNGDAYSLNTKRYADAYAAQVTPDRYNLDKFAVNYWKKLNQSIATNPYFFSAPFSGLVAPAAYNFVINFMSNHSAAQPSGYLNGRMFQQWFAVGGTYPNFKWYPGLESIPTNWYKRTDTNQYNAVNVFQDLGAQFLAYPDSFKLGGNTGKKNSFVGFNFGNLTGGAFTNAGDLTKPANLQCFFAAAATSALPDIADTAVLAAVNKIVNQYFPPLTSGFSCPPNLQLNEELFARYPGAGYHPSGTAKRMLSFLH